MAIAVTALKTDADGDAGFVLEMTNRTATSVYVYSESGWKLDGEKVADPVFQVEVGPGETVEGFMWFDHEELEVGSVDELGDVVGGVIVEERDTGKRVGRYPFKL